MTSMIFSVNFVDPDVNYATTPADYIDVDLILDYLIWSETLDDLMTHPPTADELNENATVIDDVEDTMVARCLLMDYSHYGDKYTRLIKGMGENKQYVFAFRFDGITATIPRLEAWDDSNRNSIVKHVLGNGTPANSFIKAIKTTDSPPGEEWGGTAIAGANNYINLDSVALSGAKDLYANIKIVIPVSYPTPAAETYVFTIRYSYL